MKYQKKKTAIFQGIPKCSSARQYKEWLKYARNSSGKFAGFCTDCQPEYAEAMRLENKCEYPDVQFKKIDGGWVGYFKGARIVEE